MAEFLDDMRAEIAKRLNELRPLVEEHRSLESAASELAKLGPAAPSASTQPGIRGRSPGYTVKRAAIVRAKPKRRPGRRKGSGTRAAEALGLIRSQPGISIRELAGRMGIKHNYLYKVLPDLAQEGKVTKQGRGWHPKAS